MLPEYFSDPYILVVSLIKADFYKEANTLHLNQCL